MRLPHASAALPLLIASPSAVACLPGNSGALAASQPEKPAGPKVHAFRLYTGADGNSHVQEGYVPQGADFPVVAVKFAITPPHAPPVWHNDPQHQYVVTMTGTLDFSTRSGDKFTLHAGDVLIAEDDTGSGHGWVLVGDEPWTRTYAILPKDRRSAFVAVGQEGKSRP